MPEGEEPTKAYRFAVLIDGDNASPDLLGTMMDEVGRYGTAQVRRIYGDWASGRLNNWKDALHEHAFQAVQQHNFAKGKNSTDSRLIIDAMDMLHVAPVDAFAIISSDSDYTGLAKRLRESGKYVVGIGEKKTPEPFVRACDQFVYTELLAGARTKKGRGGGGDRGGRARGGQPAPGGGQRPVGAPTAGDKEALEDLLVEAVETLQGEDGFANMSQISNWLRQKDPGFDPRSYGKRQLSQLFREFPETFVFNPKNQHWVSVKD